MFGLALEAVARSHTGWVRDSNQDTYVCEPTTGVFAVIDGMGGHASGEVAAAIARKHLVDASGDLTERMLAASDEIRATAAGCLGHRGMGCVATAAVIHRGRLRLAHVGDTRAYLASKAGCELLTRDHVRAGDAGGALTADLGRSGLCAVDVDDVEVDVDDGDLLLLCSDGLYDLVPGPELMARLRTAWREGLDPATVVDRFIRLALDRGGTDNVTVVVVRMKRRPLLWWLGAAAALVLLGAAASQLGAPAPSQVVWDPVSFAPVEDTGVATADLQAMEDPP